MKIQGEGVALKTLKAFLQADLVQRDEEKGLSFLSRDIQWYGTAEGEDVSGIEEARTYLQKEIMLSPGAYSIEYLSSSEQNPNEEYGTAHVKCRIVGGKISMLCRCTASVCPEDGEPKIYSLHMSVPDTSQKGDEYFPFSLAEQYEQELHEEFLNDMVEGGILGRYYEPSTEIYIVNQQLLDFLGYPSEEVFRRELNNSANNSIYPDDRDAGFQLIQEQLTQNGHYHIEYRMLKRDGTPIWVESRGKMVTAKDGRFALVGVINDISARKEAEELASAQNREIRNLYDTIPGGVFICKYNPDWDVTFANKGFYDFLGYTREEFSDLFQNKMINIIYEDEREIIPVLEAQLQNSNYIENTNRLVCKGNQIKWISIHAVLSQDERGEKYFYCTFVDITPQKMAEQKLRESEERYRIAIEGAGINVWEYDIKSRKIIMPEGNQRVQTGVEHESSPQVMMDKIGISAEDREKLDELFRRMEAGETKLTADYWADSASTHTRRCERVTYSVINDENGKPLKAYGASIDITQSKFAEKRYQEELVYRDSVADSVVASCCVNLTENKLISMRIGRNIGVENGHEDVVDYRARTLLFLYDNQMTEEQNQHLSPKSLMNSYNNGITVVSEEYLACTRADHYSWMRADINLVKHPETGDILAFCYNRDLTDRLVRENVLNTILTKDYSEVGIVDLRTGVYKKATGDGSFIPAGSELPYQTNVELFCNKRVSQSERDHMREVLKLEHLKTEIQKSSVYDIRFLGQTSSGEARFFLMRFQYLSGNRDIMLITRQDVDELVKKEQQRQRELEQANRVKSDFLSRMSHEIRTPLNAIIGLAELGRENLSQQNPNRDEGMDYVLKTLDSSHYLLSLINDILDMSKIESGEIRLVHEKMDCRHILGSIGTIIGTQAAQKNIRFSVDQKSGCPEHVTGDSTRVEQVLINLLNNAVKFTPDGGEITLSIDKIAQDPDTVTMRFIVRDTGVGIASDFLPRIFEPFTQEYAGITSAYGGSGLGLPIARQLTRLMNGDLTVKSSKGEGAEFTAIMRFDTPDDIENQNGAGVDTSDAFSFCGLRVLMCEDHPLNTMVVKRLLERKGCTVECAENGSVGLERFKGSASGYYGAILMDIRMPVLDGLSTARAIRASTHPDAASIPIIAMTANAYEEDIQLSKEAGMNAHLSKPIEPQILFSTLSALIKQK